MLLRDLCELCASVRNFYMMHTIGGLFRKIRSRYNKSMKTECSLTVRTYECDGYNHVNNANYLNYLEYARYEFLKAVGFDYGEAVREGYGVYIARIEIDYKKPAFTDDILVIKSHPVKKGAVSGVIAQEIWRGEDLLIEAKVTWAFVDSNGMPVKIPAKWDLPGLKPETN